MPQGKNNGLWKTWEDQVKSDMEKVKPGKDCKEFGQREIEGSMLDS